MAFAGQAVISMTSPVPQTEIHYTLDGSEPTVGSALYTGPITVAATTMVSALAVRPGATDNHLATRTVTKMDLLDAIPEGTLATGLQCRYYEGEWRRLPDFDTIPAVNSFTAETVAIPETARDEDYGLVFQGFVRVPADGVYAFSINSDDGSRLAVADTLLVDNDGLHGDFEKTGLIGLKAGYHPLSVYMFQCKGGEALGVSVAGPSLPKQPIPSSMLYHKQE
jgi:hypothetical protein